MVARGAKLKFANKIVERTTISVYDIKTWSQMCSELVQKLY